MNFVHFFVLRVHLLNICNYYLSIAHVMQKETAHIAVTWLDLQPLCVPEILGSILNTIIRVMSSVSCIFSVFARKRWHSTSQVTTDSFQIYYNS
jgi:hypothetical protein